MSWLEEEGVRGHLAIQTRSGTGPLAGVPREVATLKVDITNRANQKEIICSMYLASGETRRECQIEFHLYFQ